MLVGAFVIPPLAMSVLPKAIRWGVKTSQRDG